MEFTKKEFDQFRKDLKEAVKQVEEKYQVSIEPKSISYNNLSFDIKVTVTKNEEGLDVEREQFNSVCHYYDFSPDDYKKQVTINGKTFELYGFKPSCKKNPCCIRDIKTNDNYTCSVQTLRRGLGQEGHVCRYCGGWVEGNNPDELCDTCKATFGHTLYSEL